MKKYKVSTSAYYEVYGNTTLHTNFNYFRANQFLKNTEDSLKALSNAEGAIGRLEEQELKFYQKFGCNSYSEFINKLKEIMEQNDGKLLKKASNSEIQKLISSIISNQSGSQDLSDIELTVQVRGADIGKELKKALMHLEGVSQISDFEFSIIGNVRNMKILANKLAKKHYHIFTGKNKKGSFNDKALRRFMEAEGGFDNLLTFSYKGQQVLSRDVSNIIKPRPFPWGYRNKEVRELLSQDPEVWEPKIEAALKAIESNIKQYFAGGSTMFNQALQKTLNDTLGTNKTIIFFIGEDLKNGLLGAFGEFGTALLINYVYAFTGKQYGEREAKIIGYSNGKQDVLFDGFGIQVKNYAIDADTLMTRAGLEVNQQPADVAEYFSDSQSFLGFMANYFFNESIRSHPSFVSIEDLCLYLGEHMQGELMRLAVKDIDDTVSFYNISQQFFIPGSILLQMFTETAQKLKVEITNNGGEKWTDGVSHGPNDYWEIEGGTWHPTEKNVSAFASAINNNISIKAIMGHFSLGDFAY